MQSGSHHHIKGTCRYMCPQKELQLREREGLLHKFERLDDEVKSSEDDHRHNFGNVRNTSRGGNGKFRRNLPKADVQKTVKSFARSAAGLDKTSANELRPPQVLQETIHYLFTKILTRTDEPFNVVYDFVFDRIRSVRQDLVIQRISDATAIRILESVVNFHVYAAYRCRNDHIQTFDPHINTRHLIDCLKRLISLYEFNEYSQPSRSNFEALYVIICPESSEVISRAFGVRRGIGTKHMDLAIEMGLAYQCRNYARYFRLIKDLPPLLASCAVHHTRFMRKTAYQMMSIAYGSKTCKFPLQTLSATLLYNGTNAAKTNLDQMGIEIIVEDRFMFARFSKSNPLVNFDCASAELSIADTQLAALGDINHVSLELICPWRDLQLDKIVT